MTFTEDEESLKKGLRFAFYFSSPRRKRLLSLQDCLRRAYLGCRISFTKISLNNFLFALQAISILFRDPALLKDWSKVWPDCLHDDWLLTF